MAPLAVRDALQQGNEARSTAVIAPNFRVRSYFSTTGAAPEIRTPPPLESSIPGCCVTAAPPDYPGNSEGSPVPSLTRFADPPARIDVRGAPRS